MRARRSKDEIGVLVRPEEKRLFNAFETTILSFSSLDMVTTKVQSSSESLTEQQRRLSA